MLRSIAGLEIPDAGSISIGDKVQTSIEGGILIPPYSREIGFVFQNYALWPHMTVFKNVAFALNLRKFPTDEIRRRVLACLDLVGLGGREERYPSQLSGGQQQRVALARSIVLEPRLILLDEPLSNLDAKLREEMRVELKKLIKKVGISALYVTHDQEEAFVISDKVIVMNAGKILQYDTPDEIYNHPSDPFVASFIGHSTLVEGNVVKARGRRMRGAGSRVRQCDADLRRSQESVLSSGPCSVVIKNGDLRLSHEKFSSRCHQRSRRHDDEPGVSRRFDRPPRADRHQRSGRHLTSALPDDQRQRRGRQSFSLHREVGHQPHTSTRVSL